MESILGDNFGSFIQASIVIGIVIMILLSSHKEILKSSKEKN